MTNKEEIPYEVLERLDLRVGRVVEAAVSSKARQPALKLVVDFGPLGLKRSSAQITDYYNPDQLIDKQVVALVNIPPRQVASVVSECLVMGVVPADGKVILLQPETGASEGDVIR